jgi:hypothetical protein
LFAIGHPAWRKKAASNRHSAFPERGDFVRLAGNGSARPVRSAKNKISTGAELVLPIGYYAAAG